jgi:hypothetical protein
MKKVLKLVISAKGSYANVSMGCGKGSAAACGIGHRAG